MKQKKIVFGPISIENFVDSTIDFSECTFEIFFSSFNLLNSLYKNRKNDSKKDKGTVYLHAAFFKGLQKIELHKKYK